MTFADAGISAPRDLETETFLLRPIVVADAELDYDAAMESRVFLREWNQSTWPEDDFTVEANRQDMIKMEARHNAGEAFGYTMMNPDQSQCLGCVYIFPTDANWFRDAVVTELGPDRWSDLDALVLFWVRTSRLADGLDRLLLDTLLDWLERDGSLRAPAILTNERVEQQIAMIEETGLTRRFEIKLPSEPAPYLAFV